MISRREVRPLGPLMVTLTLTTLACGPGRQLPHRGRLRLARSPGGHSAGRSRIASRSPASWRRSSSENLVVPRTPSWLLSVRWLADEGTVVKQGDRVVEFDSSSFAGTLEDKRLAVIRTASELAAETARATATEAEKTHGGRAQAVRAGQGRGGGQRAARPVPRRLHQEKQLAVCAEARRPGQGRPKTWRPTGGPPASSARSRGWQPPGPSASWSICGLAWTS